MKRRHFLGFILDSQTGRFYHGRAIDADRERAATELREGMGRIIKAAAFTRYERRLRARRFAKRVLVVCSLWMLGCILIALAMKGC